MAADGGGESGGGAGDGGSSGGDWRDAKSFNQGEVWGSDAAATRGASPLSGLFIAGAAMLATTGALRLLTDSPQIAFLAGVAVFLVVLFSRRRRVAAPHSSLEPSSAHSSAAEPASARDAAVAALPDALRAAVTEADEDLARMEAVAAQLADRGELGPAIAAALRDATIAGRAVVDAVVGDPNDYDRARRFFKVMLPTARAAAEKFAGQGVIDATLGARFVALMRDVAAAFRSQVEILSADERVDLEVEMSVLEDRVREILGPHRNS